MKLDLSKRRLQQMAKQLRESYPESARPSHAQALDRIARMLGYKTYAAMKPALEADAGAGAPEETLSVILFDGHDYDYRLVETDETDPEHAWRDARTMVACQKLGLDYAGDDDPEDEDAYLATIDQIEPCAVLRGRQQAEPEQGPAAWTVLIKDPAVRTADGYLDGWAVQHALGHGPDDAMQTAEHAYHVLQRDLHARLLRNERTPAVFAVPGQMLPAGEAAPGEPGEERCRVLVHVANGQVETVFADRPAAVMVVDEDVLDDGGASPCENDADVEFRTPDWDLAALHRPAVVRALGEGHRARFDATLREIAGLDRP